MGSVAFNLVGVSLGTISVYKKRLRIILLTMFDKRNIILGGEGRIAEIDDVVTNKIGQLDQKIS